MEVKWTDAQLDAIKARKKNILVSAAAGSGKTAVLAQRVINRLLDINNSTDVDRLLVVTFTNAAAAEMKARISNKLSEILKEQPNNLNVLKQLSLLPSAQICTIDSFCINLVRENFFKLDIEQDFKILDEAQAQLIEQEVVEELVEELYENDDERFKALVELLSTTKNDEELISTIRKINNFISSQPFPLYWLEHIGELYNPEISIDDSEIKAYIIDEIKFIVEYIFEVIDSERSLLVEGDEMFDEYSDMINSDEKVISSFYNSLDNSWEEIREEAKQLSFINIPRVKKGMEIPYKESLQSYRKLYNSSASLISKEVLPLLAVSESDFKEDNEYLYPVFSSLIDIIKAFNERLMERKKEISSYTFSDIEHFAINLLFYIDENGAYQRTELAENLEKLYDEILVDEYQDTNAAQDKLFEMLSNGHNRFMVGDIKQSIYRFRLAMPSIFNSKKESFSLYSEDNTDVNEKIILDKNFRSKKGICEYVNFMFSNLMSKKIGELDYREEDYLYNGSDYCENGIPSAQIKLINLPDDCEKVEYEAEYAAKLILKKIKNREQITQGGAFRDVNFGDFAVLFRSAKKTMPIYLKIFSKYGIPTVANNRLNLFENKEVAILISLLRCVDNPALDIPLFATLTSVFYGYSANEIAMARAKAKAGNLYSAICTDKENFSAFINDLDKYRKYASSMSIESFLMQIINDTSYISLISVLDNFEQRRLNILKFIELAKKFDSGENVGLTAFIRFIDTIIASKLNVESAELTGVGSDCVQLMSIHKSKGLEFPICILADSAHKYNREDENASVLLNNELGIGLKVNNEEKLYRYNSLQYSAVKTVNSNASMSENLRVLYVAVTRAKEQFITLASFKNARDHIAKLGGKITNNGVNPYVIRKTQNDADLILMSALMHNSLEEYRKDCLNRIKTEDRFDFDLDFEIVNDFVERSEEDNGFALPDKALVEKIREKLSFRYAGNELSHFSSKRTASSLDEKEHSYKFFAKTKPAFLSNANLTAAQKGTAMHEFMQHCIYENARDNLESEIDRLVKEGYLTEQQAASLNREKLGNLFNSEFANRLFNSDKLYREFSVSSFVPVCELEDTEHTDSVLVQGIADCVFEEDGKLVLVDYKTDFVKDENELLDLYKKQIAFYKSAVSKTLGMEVKEAMLYSFCLDKPCVY